ncbi:uncharacterized protein BJ212DRAFT_1300577 [Suillus subaureus]|uniref:Uncharacterized protein n=1 Tax=Suillus subaureus TaxID=48587 RepID=A0A9P7JCB3_9AGAM|nr:uncharacterized protein BJ212DRAFT_1300577 [Suillus subaureus]KAG1814249.1 hypothetical protein BJ212DRAFT_1300577 [Suillus subaureus]
MREDVLFIGLPAFEDGVWTGDHLRYSDNQYTIIPGNMYTVANTQNFITLQHRAQLVSKKFRSARDEIVIICNLGPTQITKIPKILPSGRINDEYKNVTPDREDAQAVQIKAKKDAICEANIEAAIQAVREKRAKNLSAAAGQFNDTIPPSNPVHELFRYQPQPAPQPSMSRNEHILDFPQPGILHLSLTFHIFHTLTLHQQVAVTQISKLVIWCRLSTAFHDPQQFKKFKVLSLRSESESHLCRYYAEIRGGP